MLSDELYALIARVQQTKSEDGSIEFKAAREGAPKIYDTLSSFSNKNGGGIILFGIDEKNDYNLCGVYNAADLQNKIAEQCKQMTPPVRAICTIVEKDGAIILSAEIPEIEMTERPCFYSGKGRLTGSYVRVGDQDCKMTEYEVYSYECFRKNIHDELRPTPRATADDIETAYLKDYLAKLPLAKPKLAALPTEKQLELQQFITDDKPTLAGTLLFSVYPQSFFPRLCITAVVVPGVEMGETDANGARFIDNATIDGTLPQMLHDALSFVRRNMATSTIIDPVTGVRKDQTEYPIPAIREIILNALIHRDYSVHTDSAPITIRKFADRIEIENPGGLYGRLTLDTLGAASTDTRNPYIVSAMEIMNVTENRSSGIPTIRREMQLAELPAPIFENNRGNFKVILHNRIAPAAPVTITQTLKAEILTFCAVPRSREELTMQFDNYTKAYLTSHFIMPLIESGKLRFTIPEKPKSKHQKFVATI